MWLRRFDIRAPAPPQTWHLLGLEKAAQVAVSQEAADGAQGRVEGKPLPGLAPRLILALARMHCSGPTALRLESRFGAAGAADAASRNFWSPEMLELMSTSSKLLSLGSNTPTPSEK